MIRAFLYSAAGAFLGLVAVPLAYELLVAVTAIADYVLCVVEAFCDALTGWNEPGRPSLTLFGLSGLLALLGGAVGFWLAVRP